MSPAALECLSWSWILGYGPDNHLSFDGLRGKLVALAGANGGGKTSVLHALHIAMFGRPMPSDGEEVDMQYIFNGEAPKEVERSRVALVFRSEGVRYLVRREFEKSGAVAAYTLHLVDATGRLGEAVAEGPDDVDRETGRMFGRSRDAVVCNFAIDGDNEFNVPEEARGDVGLLGELAGICSAVLGDTPDYGPRCVSVELYDDDKPGLFLTGRPLQCASRFQITGLGLALRVARAKTGLTECGFDHFFCDQFLPENLIDLLRGVLAVGEYASVFFTAPRAELADKADLVITTGGTGRGRNALRFGEWPLAVEA
jgi:hypothetical protein